MATFLDSKRLQTIYIKKKNKPKTTTHPPFPTQKKISDSTPHFLVCKCNCSLKRSLHGFPFTGRQTRKRPWRRGKNRFWAFRISSYKNTDGRTEWPEPESYLAAKKVISFESFANFPQKWKPSENWYEKF